MTWRWFVIVGMLLMVVGVEAQDATPAMIDMINTARATVGAPPLGYNALLTTTAQQHSNDMAAGDFLSHTGSDGSMFWERMRQNGYLLVNGAENVLYRGDADIAGAFNQWYESEGHRMNMLNPNYTEVGVAYAVSADGTYYFTMVLGARVDVPPLPTPIVIPPSPTLAPPTNLPPTALPPTNTPLPTDRVVLPTTPTPTMVPTQSPVTSLPPTVEPSITFSDGSTPTLLPTVIAQAPNTPPPDLRLVWDDRSFALINISGELLDLQWVQFESDNSVLATSDWESESLSAPLWGFPVNDCLQVWSIEQSDWESKPSECEIRHSWIAVAPDRLFWRGVPRFTVTNRGRVIAMCSTPSGTCDVNLEGVVADGIVATEVPAREDNVTTGIPGQILLQYDGQSITVLNVSGEPVNLTGLQFQSENGVLGVETWNNGYLTANLATFPAGDCLQAWTLEVSGLPIPDDCQIRHSWVALANPSVMWVGVTQFMVFQGGNQLGVCSVAAGRCEVQLR